MRLLNERTGEVVEGVEWAFAAYRPHKRLQVEFPDASLTRQEFKDECDVNRLLKRYRDHGVPPTMRVGEPQYFDCSDVPDYAASMQILIDAQRAFMQLPAETRKELDNDPAKFIEYCQDEKNLPMLRKWGLAEPEKVEPGPMKVEVVNQPAPARTVISR